MVKPTEQSSGGPNNGRTGRSGQAGRAGERVVYRGFSAAERRAPPASWAARVASDRQRAGQTAEQRSVKDSMRSKSASGQRRSKAVKIGKRSKAVKSGQNRQAVKGSQKRSKSASGQNASGQEQQAAKKERAGTSRAVSWSNQHYPGRFGPGRAGRPAGRVTGRAAAGPAGPGSPCTATCPSRRASTPACTSTAARRCAVTAP